MWFAVVVLAGLAGLTKAAKNHFKKGWRPWIDVLQCAVLISMLPLLCFTIHFTRDFDDVGLWMYIVLSAGIILYSISFVYHMTSLWRYFSIGNITVSELSGERSLYHMERNTLTCQITEFRRKQIQINVYLKRRRDIKKKQLISAWEPTDWTSNNTSTDLRLLDGDQGENNSVVLPMLEEGAERRTLLPVKIEVEITKSCLGTYECLCSITITPSVKDNGAILAVEVEYITLKRPIFKCRTLNVYSTEVGRTIVSKINGETWIPHKKKTTLSCQIIGFRQKELLINLYLKRHNDIKNRLIHSWVSVDRPLGEDNATAGHQSGDTIAENPLLDDAVYDTTLPVEMEVVMTKAINGSYTRDCSISLTPNADTDDGAELTVEVDHTSLRWPIDKSHILNVFKGDKTQFMEKIQETLY
ncbi:unnamed protein product [Staurois parvus]|uniref:Uncharacterized protein n=1 Tax=Staurois parvus TaxID=386267 RepID=A0ABN9F319_9NEOB|nr:unnamed protein product [Staurois parvus]